ncbi:glycosyltransferase family 4 protein [Aristaeella hokkaidonensis]|uniref:Uncharacterized protein n=1 Tax=Aristaeella hokkaidonensis TaxID=3046382 RepID=A0AC61NML6_9FIRM|nr:glycosyltransferase family 4 protein [Aristaeella hokkaidonensis]QUC68213.1 hypothetical protein JYE49_05830 [Aristaeella hokkaidonensis]SNT95227.1 hypothetical protein SAMN06297421_11114 [Aristaeella hokkaidonensis]
MRILVLFTNSDLTLKEGNTSLIVRRAEAMYQEKDIYTKCYILGKTKYSIDTLRYEGISFSKMKIEDIDQIISENNPDIILYYGFKILRIHYKVKKALHKNALKSEISYDMQACNEEKIEYNCNNIKQYAKYLMQKEIFRYIINNVDSCFVVSEELKDYCQKYIKKNKTVKFYKVRCGINSYKQPKQLLQDREKYRTTLGVDNNTIVFVYSGFRSAWQMIDVIIQQFQNYDRTIDNCYFCFFCNIDTNFENLLKESFPKRNYYCAFLNHEDYFGYLSACDVGFLYREKNMTNKVAFPNKFSDYLAAGLIVGINDALAEPNRILNQYNVLHLDTSFSPNMEVKELVEQRKKDILQYYKVVDEVLDNEIVFNGQISNLNI